MVCAALLALLTASVFSQEGATVQRGSIPEELLRPRRDESPRYPIDTVIGELGRGEAPEEAYETAQRTAAALLAGNMDARALVSVNKVFLESCLDSLQSVNPRSYRLGGGREEPDGSFSFLVRFIGREEGISGELFIRFEEPRAAKAPPPAPPAPEPVEGVEGNEDTEGSVNEETAGAEITEAHEEKESVSEKAATPAAPVNAPAQKVWLFEDLILEEPRNREAENNESRHRFDFPPYERFF